MKTRIYSLLVALMSVVAFSACDDWTPAEQGAYPANTGGVSRSKMDVTVNDEVTAIGRAIVDTSDYLVTVTEKGSDVIATYEGKPCSWTYSTMPQIFTLPVGDYTVRVRSHEPTDAAWSEPYYEGSADFTVVNNNVTYIGTVTCNFASVKVEIRFSEDFYPAEDNPTIIATFTGTVKGQTVSATKNVTDAKRGNYYIFSFSLNTGNPILPDEFGDITGADSGIKIDFEVIESNVNSTVRPGETPSTDPDKHPDTEEWPEELGPGPDQPGPDQPENPSDENIKIDATFDKDAVTPAVDGEYILTIKSKEPLANIEVEIISPYLTTEFLNSVGLTSKFDLAYPENSKMDPSDPDSENMDLTAALTGFGFKIGSEVIGQYEIPFDLSPFIPLLALDDEPGRIHTFRLTVRDKMGNVTIQDLKFQN